MERKFPLAVLVALLATSVFAAGQHPTVAYTFVCKGNVSMRVGTCPEGTWPNSLIQGSDGNFYGTAEYSASGEASSNGGTVFSVTPAGKFTLLHTFVAGTNNNFANGRAPFSLTEGPDGKLYGLTDGGANGGVLYRVNKDGSDFQVIHRFCSATNCTDGVVGTGALKLGTDGKLYGTTMEGGTTGSGTIFRVTPSSGAYHVVFNFESVFDGFPSSLTLAPDGTFYGLIRFAEVAENMFHFTPATGAFQQIALNFPVQGAFTPIATVPLTLGLNGNFYGVYTEYQLGGSGLFEVEPDGSHLQFFPEYNTTLSGGGPAGLLLASDGNFWIPDNGGGSSSGDIITLSPTDGKVLQTFAPFGTAAAVGVSPSGLVQAKDGTLWGTTSDYGKAPSGHFGGGTVYSLNAGLPPR